MSRGATRSFVAEYPLDIGSGASQRLSKALRAHGNLYNACLGEARKRARAMRDTDAYQAACRMPKKTVEEKKARADAFSACREQAKFSAYSLQKYAQLTRDACWLNDHIGSADLQVTCLRAFTAVNDWVVGLRGKPRFKPTANFRSISGKSNQAVIRLRQGDNGQWRVLALGLVLPLYIVSTTKDSWQTDALTHRIKYVRLVRKSLRTRTRWVAQVVLEGISPAKARHRIGEGIVGIDLGPRTLAVVGAPDAGEAGVFKEQLCPGTEGPRRLKRRLARKLDRSRRATNPGNFDAQGRAKRGCRWRRSGNYEALRAQMREAERVLEATRKREQGHHANRVIALGATIKMEKLSYYGWQRLFGRSVGNHAPGRFVSILSRKAESAGSKVELFSTRTTKLSQYDHKSGTYTPKLLSQRRHVFADGASVDRDLYSAWLARFVVADALDTSQLEKSWPAAETLLEGLAVFRAIQPTSGAGLPKPRWRARACGLRVGRQDKAGGRGFEAGGAQHRVASERSPCGTVRIPGL